MKCVMVCDNTGFSFGLVKYSKYNTSKYYFYFYFIATLALLVESKLHLEKIGIWQHIVIIIITIMLCYCIKVEIIMDPCNAG
jgi:hypothetical protein